MPAAHPTRRCVLLSSSALALAIFRQEAARAADDTLHLGPTPLEMGGLGRASLELYEGRLPGPPLQLRQGVLANLTLSSALDHPAAFYLHGVRMGAGEQGLVSLTPGQEQAIAFTPRDAGTFLYRSEVGPGTAAAVARGQVGLAIVREADNPGFDADLVLAFSALDAQRFDPQVTAGSVIWLVNGAPRADLQLPAGALVRLRLANLAAEHPILVTVPGDASVVALDGQPCDRMEPLEELLQLGPFGRADVALQLPEQPPGNEIAISLDAGSGPRVMAVLHLVASRQSRAPIIKNLPANDLPRKIPLARAVRAQISMADGDATPQHPPGMLSLAAGRSEGNRPCFRAARGESVVLTVANSTQTSFSVHWHGHCARILDDHYDGWKPWWADSAVIDPGVTLRIGFVADRSGRWPITAQAIGRGEDRRTTSFEIT